MNYISDLKSAALAVVIFIVAFSDAVSAAQFTVTDGYAGTAGNGNSLTNGYSFFDLGIGRVVVSDGTSGSSFANGTCGGQGNVLCVDVYIYDTANNLITSYQDATSDWQQKSSNVTDGFSIEGLTPVLSIGNISSNTLFLNIPMRSVSASGSTGSYDVSGSADPFDAADANLVLGYLGTVAPNISGPTTNTEVSADDRTSVKEGTSAVHTFTADETVTWSISGGTDSALFTIDPTSGLLAFKSAPVYDPEETNTYVVEVMGTDTDGIPVTMTITVTVTPDDAVDPTITGPTTDTGVTDADAKSIPDGTTDVHAFTADEEVTWAVSGGADAGLFTIDPTSGLLAFENAPAYDPAGSNTFVLIIEAEDAAGNSATMTITVTITDTAASALGRSRDDIEQIISDVEMSKLRSQQGSIRSLTKSARDRLSGGGCGGTGDDTNGSAAKDAESCRAERNQDFAFSADGENLTLSGSGRSVVFQGDTRRISQLDIQASRQGGMTSLTLNGKLALEYQRSERALYGVFLGLSLNKSDVSRNLSGDLTSGGLTFGGYAVHEFVTNVFSEAYAAVGAGRNQLHLGDGHLTVDGDYDSTERHLGWIVSGLIEKGRWEFWPEVAVQWSQSKTSPITVSGAIPGSTTSAAWDGLTTALGTATFATEMVYNFGTQDDPLSVRFKPGILCEDTRAIVRTSHCGTTLTVGLDRESGDNRHRLAVEASVEDVGTGARKSASVSYEMRF